MSSRAIFICAFVACLTSVRGSAAEPADFQTSLFDGQTLAGWKVTGCEAVVADGAILLKGGDGFVRTNQRYGDFVLELDWKALAADNWDSGIYIRSDLPPEGKPWPARYQVNLRREGEGNLLGVKGAESKGLVKNGDWNHFKLTVVGKTASLEINDKAAWKAEGLESPSGYIGFQSEVPLGGQFLFRDIRLTEVDFKPLFNGTDLTGWEGAGSPAEECWKVEKGELLCTGQKGPWLRSKSQHGDFNLRLEYKVKEGGNSGVYVRVPEDGNHHGSGSGVEIQILDDASPRYAELQPYQFSGSVYAIAPAREHVCLTAGNWNMLEIDCRGPDYRVYHNGVLIVDAKIDEFPALKDRRREGFLGLQNHSEAVWFRRLRIGPADPTHVAQVLAPAKSPPARPAPTVADFPYGKESERQKFDFWQAKSDKPTPVVLLIHGGGWVNGDKTAYGAAALEPYLNEGISVASLNYRFIAQAMEQKVEPPVKACVNDAARALQTIRSKAKEWNIDPRRIGATGGSAGACTSLWLALHEDLADPKSDDPIARESSRLTCAAVNGAQTSLDPKELREWMPNAIYGGHAFGFAQPGRSRAAEFELLIANRESVLPWIKEYSPLELATKDDPPLYLDYPNQKTPPVLGQAEPDPTHSALYGVKLVEKLAPLGVEVVLSYPDHKDEKYGSIAKFLIVKLKAP